jgi:hypothetical protein
MKEIWKPIPKYENYDASNLGRIRRNKPSGGIRILKGSIGSDGYVKIGLSSNGKTKTFNCHVLIAIVFMGHKPNGYKNGYVIDHIDSDKSNNLVKNLRFITPRDNIIKERNPKIFHGINKDKHGIFVVRFQHNKVRHYVGRFSTKTDAINAYFAYIKNIL